MLKIRKCQWISKPEHLKIHSSTSLSFHSSGEHHLVWTTAEDDRITLTPSGDVKSGIALIFSISDGLEIINSEGHVTLSMTMDGIRTRQEWTVSEKKSLTVERKGDTVSFHAGEDFLFSLSFAPIATSISISFFSLGTGEVRFDFS